MYSWRCTNIQPQSKQCCYLILICLRQQAEILTMPTAQYLATTKQCTGKIGILPVSQQSHCMAGWQWSFIYLCIQGVSLPQTLQSQLWLRPAFLAVWALTTLRPSLDCAAFSTADSWLHIYGRIHDSTHP